MSWGVVLLLILWKNLCDLCYFSFASEIIPRVFSLAGLHLWIQFIRLFTFLYFFFDSITWIFVEISALGVNFQI